MLVETGLTPGLQDSARPCRWIIVQRATPNVWHGWKNALADGESHVTSSRLRHVDVANRMFPKVRSWLALGAPVELMSPLSVVRIVAIAALFTWPTAVIVAGLPLGVGTALLVVSMSALVFLRGVGALSDAQCSVSGIATLTTIVVAVGTADGELRAIVLALVVAATATFAGLFMRVRPLIVVVAITATTIPLVARLTASGVGVAGALVLVFVGALMAFTTAAMARVSRMAGSLDADSGVPNARGLTVHLAAMTLPTVVATVRLSGVAAARDALGHDAGSELIRRAIEDLGQVVNADVVVGRGTDDEIVLLVPAATGINAATQIATDWVRRAVGSGRYLVGDVEIVLDAHVGLAIVDRSDLDDFAPNAQLGEHLRHSALAARRAHDAGLLVSLWDGVPTTLTADDLALLTDLRSAPERGELWIAFQPQVRTPDGEVVAVEALLRWHHPTRGVVPPGRFIPLAERTGLIDRLTDWVLNEVLDAQVRWHAVGRRLGVSVNISPLSLRRIDFAERVSDAVDIRRLPPSCLTLEVTESTAFDVPQAVERLSPLRAKGIRIAIDDFGTGYTSLAVLPELPLDEIKLDQRFVRDMLSSPASEAIVRSVGELAHRLGLTAVAEGVEDDATASHHAIADYDLLQGYRFARPMDERALFDWIDDRRTRGVLDVVDIGRLSDRDSVDRTTPAESQSDGGVTTNDQHGLRH